uniref:Uncharacterized protein n=1 Tax=Borodinellopsis insignis TaxID=3229915 RepID=A0AB39U3X1_9CHLO
MVTPAPPYTIKEGSFAGGASLGELRWGSFAGGASLGELRWGSFAGGASLGELRWGSFAGGASLGELRWGSFAGGASLGELRWGSFAPAPYLFLLDLGTLFSGDHIIVHRIEFFPIPYNIKKFNIILYLNFLGQLPSSSMEGPKKLRWGLYYIGSLPLPNI